MTSVYVFVQLFGFLIHFNDFRLIRLTICITIIDWRIITYFIFYHTVCCDIYQHSDLYFLEVITIRHHVVGNYFERISLKNIMIIISMLVMVSLTSAMIKTHHPLSYWYCKNHWWYSWCDPTDWHVFFIKSHLKNIKNVLGTFIFLCKQSNLYNEGNNYHYLFLSLSSHYSNIIRDFNSISHLLSKNIKEQYGLVT